MKDDNNNTKLKILLIIMGLLLAIPIYYVIFDGCTSFDSALSRIIVIAIIICMVGLRL